MGEEVRDPARTIPRAIVIALAVAVVVYAVVAVTVLAVLGAGRVAASPAPLAELATATRWGPASVLVAVGGGAAALGALLALIAGIGRTTLAMARGGDLPCCLAAVHPTYQVPHRADVAVGAVVTLPVLTVDLRGAIGFSSLGVLLYTSSRTSPHTPSPPTGDGSPAPCRSSARRAAWCWSPPCPGRPSSPAARSSSRASSTASPSLQQPDRPDTGDGLSSRAAGLRRDVWGCASGNISGARLSASAGRGRKQGIFGAASAERIRGAKMPCGPCPPSPWRWPIATAVSGWTVVELRPGAPSR